MGSTLRKSMLLLLFLAFSIVRLRGDDHGVVQDQNKRGSNGGGSGGGGVGWGWGGGGGGANGRGGWAWGNGGGGGVYWRWGCNGGRRGQHSPRRTRVFKDDEYKMGEFAQCMVKGRCRGMRLDCPLHCGGPCVYDCRHMCKAHCKR